MRQEEIRLPGLNCGVCGYKTCEEFAGRLALEPLLIERCIHLSDASSMMRPDNTPPEAHCGHHGDNTSCAMNRRPFSGAGARFIDSLNREFDFYLEHFPEDPGPREIIIPHNPMITREMDIQPGDIMIGRPLGMSCGCPVTHCGVAMNVDKRTGVMTWCVTGPLNPRQKGFKDLGYYIAEGYEGMVRNTRSELKIGMRYYFQPEMCMLQWRHSGLLNYLNRTADGWQVRLEGLWIG